MINHFPNELSFLRHESILLLPASNPIISSIANMYYSYIAALAAVSFTSTQALSIRNGASHPILHKRGGGWPGFGDVKLNENGIKANIKATYKSERYLINTVFCESVPQRAKLLLDSGSNQLYTSAFLFSSFF